MSDEHADSPAGRREPSQAGQGVADVPVLERAPVETEGVITIETSDVTAWCPYEGTADYYTVHLEYWPDEYVVELMSYRDYFQTFREEEIGHEAFAQRVYDDLVTLLTPEWLRLTVEAPPRYGLNMTLEHQTGPKPHTLQDSETVDRQMR